MDCFGHLDSVCSPRFHVPCEVRLERATIIHIFTFPKFFYPRAGREGTPTVPSPAPSHHTPQRSRLVRSQASLGFYISLALSHLVLLCNHISTQRRPSPLRSLRSNRASRHTISQFSLGKTSFSIRQLGNTTSTDSASTSNFNTPAKIPHPRNGLTEPTAPGIAASRW